MKQFLTILAAVASLFAAPAFAQADHWPTPSHADTGYWQKFKDGPHSLRFPLQYYVDEAVRVTENFEYKENPNTQPKTLDEFFADGGGDCDDFTWVWRSYLVSHGIPEDWITQKVIDNKDRTLHAVLIIGPKSWSNDRKFLLSAGSSHHGAYEMSYLDIITP